MLDHFPSFLSMCEESGICPRCGEVLEACTCAADKAFEAEVVAHGKGCVCCLDDDRSVAPARKVVAPVRLHLGHGPRIHERASLIRRGAGF